MAVKFPDDLTESYRIHDGQSLEAGLIGGEGWRLLSLEVIVKTSGDWYRSNTMSHSYVPIAWIGTGDFVFLNLDPDSEDAGRLMIRAIAPC
jgi:hypothetical protein